MEEHNLSRRGFFTATGGFSLAAVLAACGGSSGGSTSTDTGTAGAGTTDTGTSTGLGYDAASEPSGDITLYEWEGYENDKPMWDGYNKGPYAATNALKTTLLQDDQQALAKVASGAFFDIIHPCVAYMPDWQKAGLILELDPALLPDI